MPATLPLTNLPLDVGTITAVTNPGGPVQQLTAPVLIAGQQAGNLLMTASTSQVAQAGDVPVLSLHIDPIHLSLLGLHVDTSAICLDVTATPGGGLLGDLLGGLAGGLDLAGILGQLDDVTSNLNTFLGGLEDLLDGGDLASQVGVLDRSMTVTDVLGRAATGGAAQPPASGHCDILGLSLGPINLSLLGLNVSLDNCGDEVPNGHAGPITVDVTADHTGLLGNLLCGLADGGLAGLPLNRLLLRVDTLIDRLGNLADRLSDIAQLPTRFQNVANQLVNQLEKVASRVDSISDLDRLVNRLDRVIRRLDRLIDNTDAASQLTTRLTQLLNSVTRLVNILGDLRVLDRVAWQLERILDGVFAAL